MKRAHRCTCVVKLYCAVFCYVLFCWIPGGIDVALFNEEKLEVLSMQVAAIQNLK